MKSFSTCLWFDSEGLPAAEFYTSLFRDSSIEIVNPYPETGHDIHGGTAGKVMVVYYKLMGQEFLNLNGGPIFTHSQSYSNFVSLKNEVELDKIWNAFQPNGEVRMPLKAYEWSPKYGWVKDRFGVEWQLMLDPEGTEGIFPAMLFTDKMYGKGEAAINYYTRLFPNSSIENMYRNPQDNTVMYASFKLFGKNFVLMEGPGEHASKFSEAFSITVPCKDQAEIDFYWNEMTKNGGEESQCGWLKDKFGLSWQIVPEGVERIMSGKNKEAAMAAMLQMKKFDIAALEKAAQA